MTAMPTMTATEILTAAEALAGGYVALTTTAEIEDGHGPTYVRLDSFTAYSDGSAGGGILRFTPTDDHGTVEHVDGSVIFRSVVELRDMTDAEMTARGWGF